MGKIVFFDVVDHEKSQFQSGMFGAEHEVVLHEEELTLDLLDPETEVLSIFVNSTVTEAAIEKLPKLKLIACRSTGFDNVDIEAAQARNITVENVPTYGTHTVAEYAFGLLLSLTRKLPQAIEAAHKGEAWHAALQGIDLNEKTLGIIGAGRIGSCLSKAAVAFNMKVLAFDKFPKDEIAKDAGFTYASLEEVLAQSDIISLHVAYTPESHHMINAENIKRIKPGTIIINTARGELIDNKALIEALQSGHLGGAGLDVIEGEQLLGMHEEMALLDRGGLVDGILQHSLEISILQKMPNVIVTHHNAFNTREAVGRINQTSIDNIKQFLAGTVVNKVS